MNLVTLDKKQLVTRKTNLISRLLPTKLNGEHVLTELINISNQLKIKLKENPQQIDSFYSLTDFEQIVQTYLQSNSFLYETSKDNLSQPIRGSTSPGILETKPVIKSMEKYLTFSNFEKYSQLRNTTQFALSLSKINCNLENSSHIYNPSSIFHNLNNIIHGRQNLNRVFNEVVEILTPHSIVNSVNTGHLLNEELFDFKGNIFSITLDENNIYPNRRNTIGKYYWPKFELLFSWTVNEHINNKLSPLTAYTLLEDSEFINDIFHQKKLEFK